MTMSYIDRRDALLDLAATITAIGADLACDAEGMDPTRDAEAFSPATLAALQAVLVGRLAKAFYCAFADVPLPQSPPTPPAN